MIITIIRSVFICLSVCGALNQSIPQVEGCSKSGLPRRGNGRLDLKNPPSADGGIPAQKKTNSLADPTQLLTRRTTRQETVRFGYGGTVSLVGAPEGSITIEGWSRSEVEVVGEIELRAETEEDLARLATVNGFLVDPQANHLSILTTGTHDRTYMRRVAKDFPKKLLGLPWAIAYKMPNSSYTDLEIDTGRGPIHLNGVEGGIRLTATQSETQLTLTGGIVSATIASGKVKLTIPARSWRGSGADIRLASGELTIELPVGFSGEIDATILRSGRIEQEYPGLEARERQGFTAKQIKARAGVGGPTFQFTVGDGTIYIRKASQ